MALGSFFHAVQQLAAKTPGAVVIQLGVRLFVPTVRTAGFFFNRFLGAKDISARERLLIGSTLGFPAGINPFLFAFMSGAAYETRNDVAKGWLSLFGEILLSPVVEGNLEAGIKEAAKLDFREVMNVVARAFAEDVGVSDLAAIFRGFGAASRDAKELLGIDVPLGPIAGGIVWLDRAIRGFFDPFPFPGLGPPGDPGPLDPGLRRGLDAKTERALPGAIKRLTMEFTREEAQPGALFKIGRVTKKARDKLRRLILGGGGR